MEKVILKVQGLYKSYNAQLSLNDWLRCSFFSRRKLRVLEDVSFNIRQSNIIALLGANGAGKTTLLRILANILLADRGGIVFDDKMVLRNSDYRKHVGYVSSDERSFFWRLSGRENLMFFARLYGVRKVEASERIERYLEEFGLKSKAGDLFRDYSSGTKKKFSIIRGLMHRPKLLLMDEVTNSLDAESAKVVMEVIARYVKKERCGAVWSTHRYEEVGLICDEMMVLKNGNVKKGCEGDEIFCSR